jgi:molybdenum cofactor synthesis domain-containing protein
MSGRHAPQRDPVAAANARVGDPPIRAAVLTASDRCAAGTAVDRSGPAVVECLRASLACDVVEHALSRDDEAIIESFLRRWSEGRDAVDLAVVTGGTGLSPRDVTPEAAMRVITRPHPALMELARARCGATNPRAYLSRAVAGAHSATLIVTLPGSPTGAVETLQAMADILPHAVRMLRGDASPTAHRH